MVHKRKATPSGSGQPDSSKKKRGEACEEPLNPSQETIVWPEYFHLLYKIFKAINTVLAFVSSRKQLASSFSAIRSSVESLLKQPLEIAKVAELKALLPELIKFSYIPFSALQALDEQKQASSNSFDYSQAVDPYRPTGNEGQVLVLEFADSSRGKKTQSSHWAPSSLTPAAVKKLIETRNSRFEQAVNELLRATPTDVDPVVLLVAAGQNHVPVNHALGPDGGEMELRPVPIPNERPSISQVISEIIQSTWYIEQIVHRRTVGAKEPKHAFLDPPISLTISGALLQACNIQHLYAHQVAAIDAARKGKHVVVSTSTASGKSVIYQVPLLAYLEEDTSATLMLVFPTKALAQDQKASLEHIFNICAGLGTLKIATYDGDTPKDQRAGIRATASVILTNFDTLHVSILPNEEHWRGFFQRMKILVVDELHYYTGLLGSHVAQILRRFRRVCATVGNRRIRFISCSATLSNPSEYMCKMFGLHTDDVEVVAIDGSPSGSKEYLVWDPPPVDPMDLSLGKRSSISEASQLMRFLMERGVRVILFCKIRKVCELAMKTIRADLSNEGRLDILERVRSYRGGYTREDRRKIEHEAFSGQLLGIIATNALELGIDIGALDAVIMLGFPMTISNFKQQAGRAGRRSRDSLAIMVADSFPIDQYYVHNPGELFDSSLDDLILDIDNEIILEAHLQCAGYEIPLSSQDEKWFGPSMLDICEKRMKKDADGWFHTHPKFLPFPSQHVSIRGAQEEYYTVVEARRDHAKDSTGVLEEVEFSRALFELYEGGVFMHQGRTFVVKEVSHDTKMAKVVYTDVNYTTSPRDLTRIDPLRTDRVCEINGFPICFGKVSVLVKVFGFFKLRHGTILDAVELVTPPWVRESTGFWMDIPASILEDLRSQDIDGAGAIHAAEHAFLNQFALASDVKTDCRTAKEEYKDEDSKMKRPPRLMFYDAAGRSGGVSSRAFDHSRILLTQAHKATKSCGCEHGCTSCVQSPTCRDANLISSKLGAVIILAGLLGTKINGWDKEGN